MVGRGLGGREERGETGKGERGKGKGEGACERVAKGTVDGIAVSLIPSLFPLSHSCRVSNRNLLTLFTRKSLPSFVLCLHQDIFSIRPRKGGGFWVLEGGNGLLFQRERRIHGFFNSEM
jgi:hypothetical protein